MLPNPQENIKVQLFTIPGANIDYVKSLIERGLRRFKVGLEIEQVMDTKLFIDQGLKSIPAFRVGDELIEKNELSPVSYAKVVSSSILKKINLKDMTNIIVPIDFSNCSANAVKYGIELADKLNARLNIIHIVHPPAHELVSATGAPTKDWEELRNNRIQNLNAFVEDMIPYHKDLDEELGPFLNTELLTGFAAEQISTFTDKTENALIVIGSTGSGLSKELLGSVSKEVIQQAKVPVIIISRGDSKPKISKIGLFVDDDFDPAKLASSDLTLLSTIADELSLVHVSDKPFESLEDSANKLKEISQLDKINTAVIPGKNNLLQTIKNYAKTNDLDTVVLIRKKKSILSSIFFRSLTTDISSRSDVSVLLIHQN